MISSSIRNAHNQIKYLPTILLIVYNNTYVSIEIFPYVFNILSSTFTRVFFNTAILFKLNQSIICTIEFKDCFFKNQ